MNNIIGNKEKISELENNLISGKIGHAYIFSGISGIGKYKIACEFAKAILCSNHSTTYCNNCPSCSTFGNNSDFIVIEPTDNAIKVDEIRALNESIGLKPTVSEKKVVIIRDGDKMNSSAQNALLKTLEEPPLYATIIITCSNKEKIINTIKSRSTIINFNPLTNEEVATVYNSISDSQVDSTYYEYANGSVGNLIKLINSNLVNYVLMFEKAINANNLLDMNLVFQDIKKEKELKECIDEVLDILIVKLNNNLKNDMKNTIRKINIIEEVKNRLKNNANYTIALDYMMLSLNSLI